MRAYITASREAVCQGLLRRCQGFAETFLSSCQCVPSPSPLRNSNYNFINRNYNVISAGLQLANNDQPSLFLFKEYQPNFLRVDVTFDRNFGLDATITGDVLIANNTRLPRNYPGCFMHWEIAIGRTVKFVIYLKKNPRFCFVVLSSHSCFRKIKNIIALRRIRCVVRDSHSVRGAVIEWRLLLLAPMSICRASRKHWFAERSRRVARGVYREIVRMQLLCVCVT